MLRWRNVEEAPAKLFRRCHLGGNQFSVLAFMSQKVIHYEPIIDIHDKGFRRLMRLAIPTLISGTVLQLNAIIQPDSQISLRVPYDSPHSNDVEIAHGHIRHRRRKRHVSSFDISLRETKL